MNRLIWKYIVFVFFLISGIFISHEVEATLFTHEIQSGIENSYRYSDLITTESVMVKCHSQNSPETYYVFSSYLIINSSDTVVFDFSQATCNAGIVQVPVYFISDDPVYALDFSMKFNPMEFSYVSLISHKPYLNNSANYTLADSTLRFSSFSMTPIDNNSPLISLQFSVPSGMIGMSSFDSVHTWLNGDDCSFKSISIPVIPIQVPSGITSINSGDSVLLNITLPPSTTAVWSNGSSLSSTWIYNPGTYSVAVTNTSGCTGYSYITITAYNPLPVELIQFSCKKARDGIAVDWTTLSEINNDYFIVDHSADAFSWRSLDRIEGAGSTTNLNQYNYLHVAPFPGRNYYRLKQFDFDGTVRISKVIATEFDNPGNRNSISICPNPVTVYGSVLIQVTTDDISTAIISITDISGAEIYRKKVIPLCDGDTDCSVRLNLFSVIQPGLYLVKWTGENFAGITRLMVY